MRADVAQNWSETPVDELVRLSLEVTMLQARVTDLVGRIDADGWFEDAGYLSTAALLRDRVGVSATEASRQVGEARALRHHAGIAEAYSSAQIDRPRVAILLAASRVAPEAFDRDTRLLVDTVSGLSMKDSCRALDYWKQAADQSAAEFDAERSHARRRLHASVTLGGMVRIDGELDPAGGQTVLTALRSLTDPLQLDPDDTCTPAQRRADALVDICADHLTHTNTAVTGAFRPQVSVIVALEALEGGAAQPCEFDDGVVITPETARRIACDSSISRVIVRGESETLDVGRATRTVPAALRKALIIRDRHCRFAGCERPHRWCDAHHLQHWADGGSTNLDNLILLCRRHHRAVHEGRAELPRLE